MLPKLPSDVEGNQNYDPPFVDLVTEIKKDVLEKRAVYYMTQVRDRYKELQIQHGVGNYISSRTDRLQKQLHSHFGERLQIVSKKGKPSRICSSELSVGELCVTAARLQTELSESQLLSESDDDDLMSMSESPNNDLYLSSKHLRRKMKDVA